MGEVLALDVSVSVPYGDFKGCLKTKDWSPLEKRVVEEKIYRENVGLVRAETVSGGTELAELLSYSLK